MRITAIMSTYNEREYLPLKLAWCKANGLDLYVCDNMSSDGTWEMLQDEGIKSHQYDTNGIFSEKLMQNEIKKTLANINPEWVLYMGCDLFFNLPMLPMGYNCFTFQFLSAKYTGENREPSNPFMNFTHGMIHQRLKFLFKYSPDIIWNGDEIVIPNELCFDLDHIVINYGDTKTFEQRNETLIRRQRAWDSGIDNSGHGEHLRTGKEIQWYWNKSELQDFTKNIWYDIQINQIARQAGC